MAVLGSPEMRKTARQLTRFVSVGAFCAVLDFSTYHALRALGMDSGLLIDVARAMSFIVGTTTAYVLNKRFTFDGATGGVKQVSSFVLLYGTTFFVAVGVNRLMLEMLPPITFQPSVAWAISQGTATCINFVMLKFVVFAERDHR